MRLFVALCLAASGGGAQAACKAPPVGALPQATAYWSLVDEAVFESTRFCKHRHRFDFRTIDSREDLDVVESAAWVVLLVGTMRGEGPPFPKYIRPVPVSPEGWRQLEDPANAVPFVSEAAARRIPAVRVTPSVFKNFRVPSTDRLCVDMEFKVGRPDGRTLVQTHRFERDFVDQQWMFVGFGDEGCTRGGTGPS